jgi:hypothetical protein
VLATSQQDSPRAPTTPDVQHPPRWKLWHVRCKLSCHDRLTHHLTQRAQLSLTLVFAYREAIAHLTPPAPVRSVRIQDDGYSRHRRHVGRPGTCLERPGTRWRHRSPRGKCLYLLTLFKASAFLNTVTGQGQGRAKSAFPLRFVTPLLVSRHTAKAWPWRTLLALSGGDVIGDSPAHRQSAVSRPVAGVPTVAGRGQRVMVSSRGLVLPNRLPFERWLGIGRRLSAVSSSSAWCLGDWLAFGQTVYAGRYRRAIEQTSLDYQTLRNYAWVARRFAMSRRRDTLSFGHHAEVASLAEPEQDFWLGKAEQHGWPVKRLRKEVGASLAERSAGQRDQPVPGPGNEDWVILRLQLRISEGQLETCQAAAGKASLSLEAWTILALDHAARHELAGAGAQPHQQ